jgi:hypothetical protein
MAFNWKFLVPLSIVNLLSIATVLFVARALGLNPPPELATDFVANLPRTILLLLANLPAIALALNISRRWSRHQRQLEGRGLAARHPEPAALTLPAGD